jgi:hypothetical protein
MVSSSGCCHACLLGSGGSGLNTLVVVNARSPDSIEIGNYFVGATAGAAGKLWCGLTGPVATRNWTATQFSNVLLNPVLMALTERSLTGQIQFIALSMDIPFQTGSSPADFNSTTAALFYGLQTTAKRTTMRARRSAYDLYPGGKSSLGWFPGLHAYRGQRCASQSPRLIVASPAMEAHPRTRWSWRKPPIRSEICARNSFNLSPLTPAFLAGPAVLVTNSDLPQISTNIAGYATGLQRFRSGLEHVRSRGHRRQPDFLRRYHLWTE